MKKLILLLLAAAVATTAAAQAQRDTLTFNNDYYFSKRNVEELVPVTGQNIVMLGRGNACSTAASAATAYRA